MGSDVEVRCGEETKGKVNRKKKKKVKSSGTGSLVDLTNSLEVGPSPKPVLLASNIVSPNSLGTTNNAMNDGVPQTVAWKKSSKKMENLTDITNDQKLLTQYIEGNPISNSLLFDGIRILATMSNEEIEELLRRIGLQCPVDDIASHDTREIGINWDEVAFSYYNSVQCKLAWSYLRTQSRTYRILNEILDEVRVNFKANYDKFIRKIIASSPGFPKKPHGTTGRELFFRERYLGDKEQEMNTNVDKYFKFKRKCIQEWNNLSKEDREPYNRRAEEVKAQHSNQIKKFYATFRNPVQPAKIIKEKQKRGRPKLPSTEAKTRFKFSQEGFNDAPPLPFTPLQLFINHKLNRLEPVPTPNEIPDLKIQYIEKWKDLPDEKRLKWIYNCLKKAKSYIFEVKKYKNSHPLYVLPSEFQMSRLVSRKEFKIWSAEHPPPPLPAKSVFAVFLQEFISSEGIGVTEDEDELRKLANAKWEELDWHLKEMYKLKTKTLQDNFKKKWMTYYRNVPQVLKTHAMCALPKKFRNLFHNVVGKVPLVFEYDEPVHVDPTIKVVEEQPEGKSSSGKRKLCPPTGDEEYVDLEAEGSPAKKRKSQDLEIEEEVLDVDELDPDLPVYLIEPTDKNRKLIEKKLAEEKRLKQEAKKERRKAKKANLDVAVIKTKDNTQKTSTPKENRLYHRGRLISRSMIHDAIHGIYDGRQLDRHFSVYYYYAKYVAGQNYWEQEMRNCGVVLAASKMIETFNRLERREQEMFIKEAERFHGIHSRYNPNEFAPDDKTYATEIRRFPDEPKLPPKSAEKLYYATMTKKLRYSTQCEQVTPWAKQDEKTQMIYLKQLYKLNREYVLQFEKFVKNMTPNDMLQYLLKRCQDWEMKRRRRSANQRKSVPTDVLIANSGPHLLFANETFRAELSDDDIESEPEVYELNGMFKNSSVNTPFKYITNPFKKKASMVSQLTKKKDLQERAKDIALVTRRISRGHPVSTVGPDSDLPSSDTENECSKLDELGLDKSKWMNERRIRAKLRNMETYYYPLSEYYDFDYKGDASDWWKLGKGYRKSKHVALVRLDNLRKAPATARKKQRRKFNAIPPRISAQVRSTSNTSQVQSTTTKKAASKSVKLKLPAKKIKMETNTLPKARNNYVRKRPISRAFIEDTDSSSAEDNGIGNESSAAALSVDISAPSTETEIIAKEPIEEPKPSRGPSLVLVTPTSPFKDPRMPAATQQDLPLDTKFDDGLQMQTITLPDFKIEQQHQDQDSAPQCPISQQEDVIDFDGRQLEELNPASPELILGEFDLDQMEQFQLCGQRNPFVTEDSDEEAIVQYTF